MFRPLFGGIFIFLACLSRCLAGEPDLVIRFSTQAPPNGRQFQSMLHFKERVEADSLGRMRVDIYDSGKLFEDNQVAEAVSAGRVEIGHVNLSRYAETILVADAYYLPFLFADTAVERASRAPESEIKKLIEDAILRNAGARVLWWIPEGSILLMTKDMPVGNPAALSGKRVRAHLRADHSRDGATVRWRAEGRRRQRTAQGLRIRHGRCRDDEHNGGYGPQPLSVDEDHHPDRPCRLEFRRRRQ